MSANPLADVLSAHQRLTNPSSSPPREGDPGFIGPIQQPKQDDGGGDWTGPDTRDVIGGTTIEEEAEAGDDWEPDKPERVVDLRPGSVTDKPSVPYQPPLVQPVIEPVVSSTPHKKVIRSATHDGNEIKLVHTWNTEGNIVYRIYQDDVRVSDDFTSPLDASKAMTRGLSSKFTEFIPKTKDEEIIDEEIIEGLSLPSGIEFTSGVEGAISTEGVKSETSLSGILGIDTDKVTSRPMVETDKGIVGGTAREIDLAWTREGAEKKAKTGGALVGESIFEATERIRGEELGEISGRLETTDPTDMEMMKGIQVGTDMETGEPIFVRKTDAFTKHGYKPDPTTYNIEISRLNSDIVLAEKNVSNLRQTIDVAKDMRPGIFETGAMIKSAMDNNPDAVFNVTEGGHIFEDIDPDTPGIQVRADTLSKHYDTTLSDIDKVISYEHGDIDPDTIGVQTLSGYEDSIEQMKNVRGILQGNQDAGMKLDIITKEDVERSTALAEKIPFFFGKINIPTEGYSFSPPTQSEVFDWRYSTPTKEAEYHWTDAFCPIKYFSKTLVQSGMGKDALLISSALLQSPLAVGTVFSLGQQLITGDTKVWESEKERLAGYGLGLQESLDKGDMLEYGAKIGSSPAVVEGIIIPVATLGMGYAVTGAGSVAKAGAVSLFHKLGSTAQKVITTGGKILSPFGKVLSTKASGAILTGGMFTLIEGPGLAETFSERPERFGSELGGSLFTWGMAIGGFKEGAKMYKAGHPPKTKIPEPDMAGEGWVTQPDQWVVSPKSNIYAQKTGDIGKFDMYNWRASKTKVFVSDVRSGKVSGTRIFDRTASGRAYVQTKDIYHFYTSTSGIPEMKIIPKGTTYIIGGGAIYDPITGRMVKQSSTHFFKLMGVGSEIQTPGLIDPKGVIPHLYKSSSATTMLGTGKTTLTLGGGMYETGRGGIISIDKLISSGSFSTSYAGKMTQASKLRTFFLENPSKSMPKGLTKGLTDSQINYIAKNYRSANYMPPDILKEASQSFQVSTTPIDFTFSSSAKGITFMKEPGTLSLKQLSLVDDMYAKLRSSPDGLAIFDRMAVVDAKVPIKDYVKGILPSHKLKIISADIKTTIPSMPGMEKATDFYMATGGNYIFTGQYKPPLGYGHGNVLQFGKIGVLEEGASPFATTIHRSVAGEGLLASQKATASLVRPVVADMETLIVGKQITQILPSAFSGAFGGAPIIMPLAEKTITSTGISLLSIGSGTTVTATKKLVSSKDISLPVTDSKPVSSLYMPNLLFGDIGTIQREKIKIKLDEKTGILQEGAGITINNLISDVKTETEGRTDTEVITHVVTGQMGETKQESEQDISSISTSDVGVDSKVDMRQRQDSALAQRLKLDQMLMQDVLGMSIGVSVPVPGVITPTPIPPVPIPIFLPGGEEGIFSKKRRRVSKKKKGKPSDDTGGDREFLSSITSVMVSQARYGTATHLPLSKKGWAIAEKEKFIGVPTVEMLEEKAGLRKGPDLTIFADEDKDESSLSFSNLFKKEKKKKGKKTKKKEKAFKVF